MSTHMTMPLTVVKGIVGTSAGAGGHVHGPLRGQGANSSLTAPVNTGVAIGKFCASTRPG